MDNINLPQIDWTVMVLPKQLYHPHFTFYIHCPIVKQFHPLLYIQVPIGRIDYHISCNAQDYELPDQNPEQINSHNYQSNIHYDYI